MLPATKMAFPWPLSSRSLVSISSKISATIGTFQLAGGTVTGPARLTSNAAYDIESGTDSAVLAGSVGLNKTTAGVATISAAPTYTGATTVSAGTLNFTGGLPGGNYAIPGGTLNINAFSKAIGTFQLTGGTVNGTGILTSNTPYDIESGTDIAVLVGSVGLNKTTAGVATIGSTPTYTGATTVSAGTLNFTGGLPGGNYAVSGGTLNINALSQSIGAFQISGGTVTGTGTLTSSAAYNIQGGRVGVNLAGASIGVNKTGSGTAILTGANSYTGLTTVQQGTLQLGSAAFDAVLNVSGSGSGRGTDIQGGDLVFDYSAGGSATDPIATIRNSLQAGSIHTSTGLPLGYMVGYVDNTVTDTVLLQATVPGDTNLDGTVTLSDLNTVLANFNKPNQTWSTGDFNYDGLVTLADLNEILANFNKSVASGFVDVGGDNLASEAIGMLTGAGSPLVGVPEPGTLALLAVGLIGLLAYAWRRRK